MTDGTSQGLFIVVAIVIFGIFVVLAYILFEDTLSPAMASMFGEALEKTTQELSKSIIPVSDLKLWVGGDDAEQKPEYLKFSPEGFLLDSTTHTALGVYIPHQTFEKNKEYELSFNYTVLEGTVNNILGHMTVSDNTKVYVDGQLTNSTWHMPHGTVFPKDNETHHIRVVFNTNRYDNPYSEDMGNSSSDRSVYIQPNRYKHIHNYKLKVDNFKLIKK